jgi:hypothetical protein
MARIWSEEFGLTPKGNNYVVVAEEGQFLN